MHRFFDWLMLLLYVAILFLLVRPGSQGPKLAETFSNGIEIGRASCRERVCSVV